MKDVYQLQLDGLPETSRVLAFHGDESLSAHYQFEVYTLIPVDEELPELESLPDKRATLKVLREDGTERTQFHGVVFDAECVHAQAQFAMFRFIIRPALWRAVLSEHSRVWV